MAILFKLSGENINWNYVEVFGLDIEILHINMEDNWFSDVDFCYGITFQWIHHHNLWILHLHNGSLLMCQ